MRLRILLIILLSLPMSWAIVDPADPVDGHVTNNDTINFNYYVSLQGLQNCFVKVGGQNFPDPDVQNEGMNVVQVQNIAKGTHAWNVSCTGDTSEMSTTRQFIIDTDEPALQLTSPANGSTQEALSLQFTASDSRYPLACDTIWNDEVIDSYTLSEQQTIAEEYSVDPGDGSLTVRCEDEAGNSAGQTRSVKIQPTLFLELGTDKPSYGLAEAVELTVDSVEGSQISIDICPDEQGFVQCTSALIDSDVFPQTITLPYMNKTGDYIVDALARIGESTISERIGYAITNSMVINVEQDETARIAKNITLTAKASGGIPPYSYSWDLTGGDAPAGSIVSRRYTLPGTYHENVTVTDAAGNSQTKTHTIAIDHEYAITVSVLDDITGKPIPEAEVDIGGSQATSDSNGKAILDVPLGTHTVFVSAAGYAYKLLEEQFNRTKSMTVRLQPEVRAFDVRIDSPKEDVRTSSRTISYSLEGTSGASCSLYWSEDGDWFTEIETKESYGDAQFSPDLKEGFHHVRVECTSEGVKAESDIRSFTIVDEEAEVKASATNYDIELQGYLESANALVESLDSYSPKDKEAAELLGYDSKVRNLKRALQQAVRDLDSLNYREDLSESEKAQEKENLLKSAKDMLLEVPGSLEVVDSHAYVKYVEEDDIDGVVSELAGLDEFTDNEKFLAKRVLEDQQRFTLSTKLYQVNYNYPNRKETVTLVQRTLSYADDLEKDYVVIEMIPKEIIGSARDIELITGGVVLKDDPILEFGLEQNIIYVINKKVDFKRMELVSTVLTRHYADAGNVLTGFAIMGGIDSVSTPLIVLLALLILAYLAYYFDLLGQLKYLKYRFGKKEQVHYMRVMITDAEDHLAAGNYEKAELLYKEIRMTYDNLEIPAKNELYEDILQMVHKMDAYYFNMVMVELDQHLKAGEIEEAIESYEKLTGTFERLDDERQQKLIDAVSGMAKRLGLEVPA